MKSFAEQQYVFLATVEGDQPRVRPVTLINLWNRMFVATGSDDAKTQQIRKNYHVELCFLTEKDERKGSIRAECHASVIEDKETKAAVFERVSFIKEFFKTAQDPAYALIEFQPTLFEYMRPGSIEAVRLRP
ncbi:MAG: pyridoxamine 5'-phosphate oxidase family protein [Candidatus Bathyarchaeota archaeon]|nr:MAG: pyridoxamine 5'-phosphate oxidase family protein [Candidatus Bathyarchaeota archaeon]